MSNVKALSVIDKKWRFGYRVHKGVTQSNAVRYYVMKDNGMLAEIDPETICTCTEKMDSSCSPIYEHDKVKGLDLDFEVTGVVQYSFDKAQFVLETDDGQQYDMDKLTELEVIGNIHERH